MSELKFINECAPIDLELCELLGEKPSDFVVLQANGETVPGYGTPYDSAANRQRYADMCGWLNDADDEILWTKFLENWGKELANICDLCAGRPVFSIVVSRVCPGRSKYLHCAIRLFEELGVESWVVEVVDNTCRVRLMVGGIMHASKGTDPAETICAVVVLALRNQKP